MSGRIELDGSKFPLVRITLPANPTEEDTVAVYRDYDVLLARGRHVLLVDLRELNPLFGGARARQVTLREVESRQPLFDKLLIAEARIVSGSIVRGIVTAFEWMRKRPRAYPLEVLEDEKEGLRWLNEKLEAEGRSLPPVSMRPGR
jgi:hypothetical protein